jgi:mannose-6-phosphate isomerase-like protein (cupin superfamily)
MAPTSSQLIPLVIAPTEGRAFKAFGSEALFKLGGAETAGSLSLGVASTPPGIGPPLHVHRSDDEIFVILEGEISFHLGGRWTAAGPGTVVYLPRGVPHTFRNSGVTPSRHCVITTPSGFEMFFARSAEVFATPGPPDPLRLKSLADEYGYELLGPPPE